MGRGMASSQFGAVRTTFVGTQSFATHNPLLKSHQWRTGVICFAQTAPLDPEGQRAVRDYLAGYNLYHMSHGNEYAVRNVQAKPIAQNAEPGRPAWALEPLPGFDRVVVAAPVPRAITRLPMRHARLAPPPPPTPSASASSSTPSRTPVASASSSTPTRVASRTGYYDHGEAVPHPQTPQTKRKSSEIIDISSDEEEEEFAQPARKKPRFPSIVVVDPDVIDLTV
ncbi:hypothetical protein DFH09DRAFT_1080482 [Mycena vulgaris]|nr:hypothetical protein DFH09DRAFT_1080482 [Mycena vulgaris]